MPYLQVLLWATIPTLLYYLGILLAVEIDARRFGAQRGATSPTRSAGRLLLRFGYHFLSLFVIIVFLALDVPPFRAVVYATVVAALFGAGRAVASRRDPLHPTPSRSSPAALRGYGVELYRALAVGIRACCRWPRSAPRPASSPRSSPRPGSGRRWPTLLVARGAGARQQPDRGAHR